MNEMKPKEKAVLELIKEDPAYENYFFNKVTDEKWFYPLKQLGYFNPENAPEPVPAGREGYFIMPQWNVLQYLERLSKKSQCKLLLGEIIEIINDVTEHIKKKNLKINNYRIWVSFMKIIENLPKEMINTDILKMIEFWLDSHAMAIVIERSSRLVSKLLVKDSIGEDIKKAEMLLNIITDKILTSGKDISNSGIFQLKKLFNEHNELIAEKCSSDFLMKLILKIKPFLRKKESFKFTVKGKSYLIRAKLSDKEYQLDLFGEIDNKDFHIKSLRFPAEECYRNKFVLEVSESIASIFPDIDYNLVKAYAKSFYNFLYDTEAYESLYRKDNNYYNRAIDIYTFILTGLLKNVVKDTNKTKEILGRLLREKYFYLLKVALYIIGTDSSTYKKEFIEFLSTENGWMVFEEYYFEDELKHVLKNLNDLSCEEVRFLDELIAKGPEIEPNEEYKEKICVLWKQARYQALSAIDHFNKRYNEQKKISGRDVELRPPIGEIKIRMGEGKSPLTEEEILELPPEKLASIFVEFRTENYIDGPTIGGLAEALENAVKAQPNKFISRLSLFIKSPFIYVDRILTGIRNAWNEKKGINWGSLLNFIEQYISNEDFWNDKFMISDDGWNVDHQWLVGTIGWLIRDGCKEDEWSFPEKHIPKAREILLSIIERFKITEKNKSKDYLFAAYNSPIGKTIIALLNLALRIARSVNDDKDIKWDDQIKQAFDGLLEKNISDAYTLLGHFSPQFHYYLDKEWLRQKVEKMTKENNDRWEPFMAGYLNSGYVYTEIYEMMRYHYSKAIDYFPQDNRLIELLVDHISLGYLYDAEDLSDTGLFGKLLRKNNYAYANGIINFFWRRHDSEDVDKVRNKAQEVWKCLFEHYKEKKHLDDHDKLVLSNLSKLTVFLPEINEENYQWLILSAQFVYLEFNDQLFVEYLNQLKNKGDNVKNSALYVGKVLRKILDSYYPDFERVYIRDIVNFLYQQNTTETRDLANEICNIYGENGYEFLRDIYNKYRNE